MPRLFLDFPRRSLQAQVYTNGPERQALSDRLSPFPLLQFNPAVYEEVDNQIADAVDAFEQVP